MLVSGSGALFVELTPQIAAKRCFCTTAALSLRRRPTAPAPAVVEEVEEEPERPMPGVKAQKRAIREQKLAELAEAEKAKRGDAKEPDSIWISVYLSLGTRKRSGLQGAGCSTYTGMTYDLATALKADNGERWKGIPYRRTPDGFRVPTALRPYRMMMAIGGFNSAASAKMFLKAWKYPAVSRFLRAPDLDVKANKLDRHGIPIKMSTRPNPRPGEQFFHNNAVSSLDYKFAVAQRLCSVHPFDKMPLRVALYNTLASRTWQDAIEGDWPGGPNDSMPAVEGWTPPPARIASSDLQRRYPLPSDTLERLQPELRSQSQPWFGPTLEAGDAAQTRQVRPLDTMVRTVLGTATKADRAKLLAQEQRRGPTKPWQAMPKTREEGVAGLFARLPEGERKPAVLKRR